MWQASQADGSRMAKLCDWSAMTKSGMGNVKVFLFVCLDRLGLDWALFCFCLNSSGKVVLLIVKTIKYTK